jgi:hypothetical protein
LRRGRPRSRRRAEVRWPACGQQPDPAPDGSDTRPRASCRQIVLADRPRRRAISRWRVPRRCFPKMTARSPPSRGRPRLSIATPSSNSGVAVHATGQGEVTCGRRVSRAAFCRACCCPSLLSFRRSAPPSRELAALRSQTPWNVSAGLKAGYSGWSGRSFRRGYLGKDEGARAESDRRCTPVLHSGRSQPKESASVFGSIS